VGESLISSRDPFGRRDLYAVETETAASIGESLHLVVRRRAYYAKVEGWRPAEVVERRVVRADDPIEIGEARAELERLAELRNEAAWGLRQVTRRPRWLRPANPLRRIRASVLYTVESGVRAGERGDRLELGVRVWHYGGWLDGWQPTAIVHGMSVPADDPVALGEARARLHVLAEHMNEDVLLAGKPSGRTRRTGSAAPGGGSK
jgi:hypothetical protein